MANCKERVLNLIESKNSIVSKLSLIEYELKIIIFISTLNSYKVDSLLRPFPNDYLDDKKDFNKLVCTRCKQYIVITNFVF